MMKRATVIFGTGLYLGVSGIIAWKQKEFFLSLSVFPQNGDTKEKTLLKEAE